MRFRSIHISNLRAVRLFELNDLKDFIVIAGPNGCGKSCVFDAIRLLKSLYAGYAQDEHMQWFSEFAINPQDPAALQAIFRDFTQPVRISATIEFTEAERAYLLDESSDLIWPIAWQRVTGQKFDYWTFSRMVVATQLSFHRTQLNAEIVAIRQELRQAMSGRDTHEIAVEISPDGNLNTATCLPAEVSFQAYAPQHLGVIEYHSASRAYTRQPLAGINLDPRAFEDQRRQQALYNWQGKYQNVKSELATGYLRNLIAVDSGEPQPSADLNATLQELFRTFFPDKEYEGVKPTAGGGLQFPVRLPGGETHDIDELSSGEKEILYGYLRLRNSTPRQSVVLLDEPKLHLNPSLLQGFTDFYHRHLGVGQGNQLWLVTHSDTLLRQAVGNSNYGVYHMLTASASIGNQASEVMLDTDADRVVVDLVGDLAAYRPHAKVVILEGAYDDSFDIMLVRRLFPDFAKRVNLVSAGSKRRVGDLYEVLNEAASESGMANRFFAIMDSDAEERRNGESGARVFEWDVYHIENYLLDLTAVRTACRTLAGVDQFASNDAVKRALRAEAEALVPSLVLEELQAEVNDAVIRAISIGGDPSATDPAAEIAPSLRASIARVVAKGEELTPDYLEARAEFHRRELESALDADAWLKRFPGRRVLKRFVNTWLSGVSYEPFRNVLVDALAAQEARPLGMKTVLDQIVAS